nr:AMP-binding protein [Burkholderia pseudomallei]
MRERGRQRERGGEGQRDLFHGSSWVVVGRTSGRRGRRARALARRAFRAISSTAAGHWAAMRHLLTTETNRNRGGANRGGVRKAPPGAPADVRRARAGARIDASTRRRCGCCARIAIFDERLREAQSGAVGEIVISGPCLARGYPDDPKQAAEKCLAHPSHAGERAYRMGNLARRLPDGAIQFVGRLDDQVKIRGYLVEPGEVEIAIARQPGVRRRAVVATSPADGAPREFVAFAVPDDPAALRRAARSSAACARAWPHRCRLSWRTGISRSSMRCRCPRTARPTRRRSSRCTGRPSFGARGQLHQAVCGDEARQRRRARQRDPVRRRRAREGAVAAVDDLGL